MNRTAIACTIIGSLGLVISAAVLSAGPLDPPSGPVSSSYKTLTEVEPRIAINTTTTPGDSNSSFKITKPGSYYLTGNITGASGKAGIEIGTNGVTLDLSGFEVVGTTGSLSGIRVDGSLTTPGQITVRNGLVRGWGESGIDFLLVTAAPVVIEHIGANNNSVNGIYTGPEAVVSDREAHGNTVRGISCSSRSLVQRCNASNNGTGSGAGLGIFVGSASAVRDCVAVSNGLGAGGGNGISADLFCTVSGCTASDNGKGAGGGTGITASNASLVENCTSTSNGAAGGGSGFGISAASYSQVRGCVTQSNISDGIRCGSQCTITGNSCVGNCTAKTDGGNLHATGSRNRLDGNHCDGAVRGIKVDLGSNVIVRNTCGFNTTNFDIVAGNDLGPIGTAATATNPWANIQY